MATLYDRNFLVGFVSQVLFTMANSILLTHFGRWIGYIDGSETELGLIAGTANVMALVIRPWLGQWIDHFGSHVTWGAGVALFALSTALQPYVTDLGPSVCLLRIGSMVGAATVFASSLTYVTNMAPTDRRTEAIGVIGAGGFLGLLFGPTLGDLFLNGPERTLEGFRLFFWSVVALAAISLCLEVRLRPATGHANGRRRPQFFTVVRRHWPGPILIVNVVFGACLAVPFVFLSRYVDIAKLDWSVGSFFAIYAGWGLLVRVLTRQTPERVGRRVVVLAGLACWVVGLLSFLGIEAMGEPWLIIAALACGSGHALIFPSMVALSIEPFPAEVRGIGSVLTLMVIDLGMSVGAPIFGVIAKGSYPAMFGAAGGLCLVTGLVYGFLAFARPAPGDLDP